MVEPGEDRPIDLYRNDNRFVTFTPLSGVQVCVRNERTTDEECSGRPVTAYSPGDRDVFRITCPSGSPPKPDLANSIPLRIRGSANSMNLAVQAGCQQLEGYCQADVARGIDGGSPELDISYTMFPEPGPMAILRVKVFGSELPSRMYYAEWKVTFPPGGEEAFTQENGQWLEVAVPSDATSIEMQVTAFNTPPGTNPGSDTGMSLVLLRNTCPNGNSAILSRPSDPEWAVLHWSDEMRIGVPTADALFFEPLSGQMMCANVGAARYCSGERIEVPNLAGVIDDTLVLDCPPPLPLPDQSNVIPLRIRAASNSPNLAMQIGCRGYDYCQSQTEETYAAAIETVYPMLNPMSTLRVKVFGPTQNVPYREWLIRFSDSPHPQRIDYQPRAQWLEIQVPRDATSIEIVGTNDEPGSTPVPAELHSMTVTNERSGNRHVIMSSPLAPDSQLLFAGSSGDEFFYSNNAVHSFFPISGIYTCVTSTVTGRVQCGTDLFTFTGLIDQDQLSLRCPGTPPPTPDMSSFITISIVTHDRCPSLVVQIGCDGEGNPCIGETFVGENQNVALEYPTIPPAPRLRLKVVGMRPELHRVQIGLGPQNWAFPKIDWFVVPPELIEDAMLIRVYCD